MDDKYPQRGDEPDRLDELFAGAGVYPRRRIAPALRNGADRLQRRVGQPPP
jgi:hypothetical protein